MEKLQISYQKAAQLMAFVLDMAEHGEFKQCPQNASSNEKYVIQNENVAKAMKNLVTKQKNMAWFLPEPQILLHKKMTEQNSVKKQKLKPMENLLEIAIKKL